MPFAIRRDDELVSGRIDRLVRIYDGSCLAAAEILDFKSDAIGRDDEAALTERLEFYRPQLAPIGRPWPTCSAWLLKTSVPGWCSCSLDASCLFESCSGQWSVVSGQWSVVSGQWSVVSGQWAVGSGQWAVGSGQWKSHHLQSMDYSLQPVPEPISYSNMRLCYSLAWHSPA